MHFRKKRTHSARDSDWGFGTQKAPPPPGFTASPPSVPTAALGGPEAGDHRERPGACRRTSRALRKVGLPPVAAATAGLALPVDVAAVLVSCGHRARLCAPAEGVVVCVRVPVFASLCLSYGELWCGLGHCMLLLLLAHRFL